MGRGKEGKGNLRPRSGVFDGGRFQRRVKELPVWRQSLYRDLFWRFAFKRNRG